MLGKQLIKMLEEHELGDKQIERIEVDGERIEVTVPILEERIGDDEVRYTDCIVTIKGNDATSEIVTWEG